MPIIWPWRKPWVPGSGGGLPNTPTLSVSDNGDGSGGVATITGSTGGSSNVVNYALWTGSLGPLTWTSAGSRTGDGTVAVGIAPGLYLFQVVSTTAGGSSSSLVVVAKLTPAVYTFTVTATDSLGATASKTFTLSIG